MGSPLVPPVKLHTTLNRLQAAGACAGRYAVLLASLGGPSFDHDAPINLLTILESNGVDDCLWALCATAENCGQVAWLMAADCAELVLPTFERQYPDDRRPRAAIEAARGFALGTVTSTALAAAWAAARAAWAAAAALAAGAAWAAARTAWAAARTAARAAEDAWQAERARHYCPHLFEVQS